MWYGRRKVARRKISRGRQMHEVTGSHQPCFTKWKTDAGFSLHEVSFLVDLVFHCALNTKESFGVNIDKESWTLKNLFFQTVVLEKTLESPSDSMETKPVNPKGNQPWYSLEGLMLKLKHLYLDHLMWKTDSLEKQTNPDAGKDWRQEEESVTED